MNAISFTVPGRPVPKGRPRVTRYGTYNPKATQLYEKAVRDAWKAQSGKSFPGGVPLAVYVGVHFEIPRSLSKKQRLALEGQPHTKQRGDLDNVVKSVLDALNGAAFPDDAAVCTVFAYKDFRAVPSTKVIIMEYKEDLYERRF